MAEVPKTHLVTVSAWVEPDTHVVLIESPILRRLQAENWVLRRIVAALDGYIDEEVGSGGEYEGWEISNDFGDRVQRVIDGNPKPSDG